MRKYINKLFLAAVVFAVSACTDGFEKMNTNPNEPTNVPTNFLLTSAQKQLVGHVWDEWANGRFGLLYSQYWAQNAYSSESRYQFRAGTNNNYWLYYYSGRDATLDGSINGGGLMDLQRIIEKNQANLGSLTGSAATIATNQIAVSRIMKAWIYQIMTDIWGDIPYTQALKPTEFPQPAYDTQKDIYFDLLKELKEASAQIDPATNAFPTGGDLIFGGDSEKWKKFANSLRLRIAMRMSDVEPAAAATAINEALAAGVFTSNADDACLKYLNGTPSNNPINEDRKTREDFAVSNTMVDFLNKTADPRLSIFASKAVNSDTYVGMTYGLTEGRSAEVPVQDVSQPGPAVLAADAPGILMTYSEVMFIKSEAAARGITSGSAEAFYNEGIRASMDFWGKGSISGTAIDQFIAANAYDSADPKVSIGKQKWVAMYMQGLSAWAEYRRMDFGILRLPKDGVMQGTGIPLRKPYPNNEQLLNLKSYTAGVAAQGADQLDTKLWWDVNPNKAYEPHQ